MEFTDCGRRSVTSSAAHTARPARSHPRQRHRARRPVCLRRRQGFRSCSIRSRAEALDAAGYRYRRILFPVLAGLFGLAGPAATVFGMIALTVVSYGAAVAICFAMARPDDAARRAGVALFIAPGMMASVRLLTIDVMAIALFLGALAMLIRRRSTAAIGLFAAAALTKEVYGRRSIGRGFYCMARRGPAYRDAAGVHSADDVGNLVGICVSSRRRRILTSRQPRPAWRRNLVDHWSLGLRRSEPSDSWIHAARHSRWRNDRDCAKQHPTSQSPTRALDRDRHHVIGLGLACYDQCSPSVPSGLGTFNRCFDLETRVKASRMTPQTRRSIAMTVLLLAWLTFRKAGTLIDSDLWWHLATGDWIRANGIPHIDPFSWTAAGAPWQPNAWLSDVLMSAVRDLLGLGVLSILRALLVPAVGLVILWWCRQHSIDGSAAVATSAISTIALAPFIVERPSALGMLLVIPMLTLLKRPLTNGTIVGLTLLMALWANLHGSVVAGALVLGAYTSGMAVSGIRTPKQSLLLLGTIGGALANPYGWSVFTHALTVRQASVGIDEWQPLSPTDPRDAAYLALIIIAMAVLVTRRRRQDVPLAFVTIGLALGTVLAVRTAALFVVAAAPLVAIVFERIGGRLRTERYRGRPHPGLVAVVAAGLVLAFGVDP